MASETPTFRPELLPGVGVGTIRIGATVREVLSVLQQNPDVFNSVEIKFCAENTKAMDIVLEIPCIGMNIVLDSKEQRVRLIELWKPREYALLYCGVPCCGPKVLPTFPSVYHQLGPTMPGEYNEDLQVYMLVYPGVTFLFPIPPEYGHCFASERDLAFVLPDGSTPVASRIQLHAMGDPTGAVPPPLGEGSCYLEPVLARPSGEVHFLKRGCSIDFNSTPQDVVGYLGKPSGTMQKRIDKLRIHALQGTGCAHYFFNYNELGLDVLFDANRHCIRKLVLHTNCPAHVDFNDYCKCNFELRVPVQRQAPGAELGGDGEEAEGAAEEASIGPDMLWREIESLMGPPEGNKPLMHTDKALGAMSGSSLFYGYKDVIFEVTRFGSLATVILFKQGP